MHPVDLVKIQFSESNLLILNVAMAFLIFGVALDVKIADFRTVAERPKSIVLGLVAQYLLFPALTMGVILLFRPPVSVALGMLLVAGCPSGNMTNYLVHFAKANIALSLTLNAVILATASILTPALFEFWSRFVPESEAIRAGFSIPFSKMVSIIFWLILMPLAVGMWLNHRFPAFVERVKKGVQRVSLVLFFAILVVAVVGNRGIVADALGHVFVLVALQNGLALALGYGWGRLFRLAENDCRTLSFETGVHNTTLGLILIFNFFGGLGGMALIAAWYGIWDLVSGYALAAFWRRKN